ncbi:MAG: hypothetical protein WCJ64_01615 [Rhodospirillaceae bacterium]
MRKSVRLAAMMLAAAGMLGAMSEMASAQTAPTQPRQQKQGQGLVQLPPALLAAIATGRPDAVQQAIDTLSGGNYQQAAQLAVAVVTAAEQMLATNPQNAIQMAAAAVNVVKAIEIQRAAVPQTESVVTTAARIFINPVAERLAPQETASLSAATMQVAISTGNTNLVTVVTRAETTRQDTGRQVASAPQNQGNNNQGNNNQGNNNNGENRNNNGSAN